MNPETTTTLAIVAFAALIHASFQLSVSVLTLLSGHAIGARRSYSRLMRLTTSYLIGAGVMTILLLSGIALVFRVISPMIDSVLLWTIGTGVLASVGVAVWLFYYRKADKGTSLWVPRSFASFLSDRSKATKRSVEAFSLGLSGVIGELLFVCAPLSISALALSQVEPSIQLFGVGIYGLISLLSLVFVWVLVGSGHRLSRIQMWREENKHFLQFAAASGLIVLGFFVYVNEVLVQTAGVV